MKLLKSLKKFSSFKSMSEESLKKATNSYFELDYDFSVRDNL